VLVDAVDAVKTSFVVVDVEVVVDELVCSAPTVADFESEWPLRPALIRITAIVTAARNAAGAPYRVSS